MRSSRWRKKPDRVPSPASTRRVAGPPQSSCGRRPYFRPNPHRTLANNVAACHPDKSVGVMWLRKMSGIDPSVARDGPARTAAGNRLVRGRRRRDCSPPSISGRRMPRRRRPRRLLLTLRPATYRRGPSWRPGSSPIARPTAAPLQPPSKQRPASPIAAPGRHDNCRWPCKAAVRSRRSAGACWIGCWSNPIADSMRSAAPAPARSMPCCWRAGWSKAAGSARGRGCSSSGRGS